MKIHDVTIPLSKETPVWEGDKGIRISQVALIRNGRDFNVSRIEMGVHAGTHIDAPRHLFVEGNTVDQISLDRLVGKVEVIRIPDCVDAITPEVLWANGFNKDIKRLLIRSANSNYWRSNPHIFHDEYTAVTTDAARIIAEAKLYLVGIDYFSISPMNDLIKPHQVLLESGVIILENLNLSNVPPGFYDIYCLPLKLIGTDGAPARVILTEP